MDETPILPLGAKDKRGGRQTSRLASHAAHVKAQRLHLIQEQLSQHVVPQAAGYRNLLSEATQSDRRVQGVPTWKDCDSVG
jgi:hypothetical protein